MKRARILSIVLLAGLGAQLACSGDGVEPGYPFIPEATEPLALTLRTRAPVFRESLPKVDVSSVAGGIRVQVARPDIACTLAEASVGRAPGTLTVVARVWGNPLALCAGGFVVEYWGVIADIEPGRYTVHIYEGFGDGTPRKLGARTVTVAASAP